MLSSPWSQIGPWAEGMAMLRSPAQGESPLLRDLLWHSFGAGGSASQVSLSRGAGDAKRGGFGLARRHGAVNSERAVVLTDCKCFAEQKQWLRTGAWWQGLILLALTRRWASLGAALVSCRRVHRASRECVLSRDGVAVVRALLPQVFWLWCPAVPTDGRSKNAGSLHLPGWAGAERHWGSLFIPLGWKCSLALGEGEGAPGVVESCTVPPLHVFISLFAWMSSAPSCHKEVWR